MDLNPAYMLFKYEDFWQKYQRSYFNNIYRSGDRLGANDVDALIALVNRINIMMPRIDRARVIAVFYDDYGGVHIVWDAEHVPLRFIDEAYARIRCREYHRRADIESIRYKNGRIFFPSTYGPPNTYDTSIHSDGVEPASNTIYVWTWNHMMATQPSLDVVLLRGGYRRESGYMVMRGTRNEAEEWAREVTPC